MKKETIEKYLDKCGVSLGPWGRYEEGRHISNGCHGICTASHVSDSDVLAASRNMLVALIDICYDRAKTMNIDRPYHVHVIEQALSRPWEEIRKELEEMEVATIGRV